MSLARGLYSAALTLLSPLIWQRVWREHDDQHPRCERLGIIPATPSSTPALESPIWLHAASLGEVVMVASLVEALRRRYPTRPLVMTTMTATGAAQAARLLHSPEGSAVLAPARHHYLPLDFPCTARRFVTRLRPALAILVETELWPNLMAACAREGVPLGVVNGRLSPRAFDRYRKVASVMRESLANVSWLGAKAPEDLERFIALGLPAARGVTVGSLKFELEISPQVITSGQALQVQFDGRPVWIAASTHEGEDAQILTAHAAVRAQHPDALLLLVPRHPQRFEAVAAQSDTWCQSREETNLRRSHMHAASSLSDPAISVLVGDSLGELLTLYAASDIAFVGGSLVPVGGHNMLEPAALGLPLLSGPSLANFNEIAEVMTEEGALQVVADSEALAVAVAALFADNVMRKQAGEAARQVVARNRGALSGSLAEIAILLPA
ncbi:MULTISPECIES: 3-deoxy-D-manno-octulosonic acid transferase [Cobetia]|uniref:3-deoxy-D-manno-octulosonic acid transferase n=1 Tax=Cobetia crustatorum TaxID=553385 RepID=A0A558HSB0_9GAMM|nr:MULTISPECIES: 3-deoxy-D-manno-octulosonic acid transferase [Cobetia]TVU71968.1 3-deoxy-D-manno-octulosonic acid transferase [Cobetia crustatorum]